MSFSRQTIEQRFKLASIAIDNALADQTIAQALAGFGYTAERVRQGGALLESAQTHYQRHKGACGDAQTASDSYAVAQAAAQSTYRRYVKMARIALEGERGMQEKLSLAGERKHTQAGRQAQAQQFYTNALFDTAIQGKLAAFGITKAMLAEGQHQLVAVVQSDSARQQRLGAEKDAKRERDTALLALANWMRDFTQIARMALRDRPQLLQMLKIEPPAARRAAHRTPATAAPAEALETTAPLPSIQAPPAAERAAQTPAAKRNGTKPAAVAE